MRCDSLELNSGSRSDAASPASHRCKGDAGARSARFVSPEKCSAGPRSLHTVTAEPGSNIHPTLRPAASQHAPPTPISQVLCPTARARSQSVRQPALEVSPRQLSASLRLCQRVEPQQVERAPAISGGRYGRTRVSLRQQHSRSSRARGPRRGCQQSPIRMDFYVGGFACMLFKMEA